MKATDTAVIPVVDNDASVRNYLAHIIEGASHVCVTAATDAGIGRPAAFPAASGTRVSRFRAPATAKRTSTVSATTTRRTRRG
jgi:hypothetical protein